MRQHDVGDNVFFKHDPEVTGEVISVSCCGDPTIRYTCNAPGGIKEGAEETVWPSDWLIEGTEEALKRKEELGFEKKNSEEAAKLEEEEWQRKRDEENARAQREIQENLQRLEAEQAAQRETLRIKAENERRKAENERMLESRRQQMDALMDAETLRANTDKEVKARMERTEANMHMKAQDPRFQVGGLGDSSSLSFSQMTAAFAHELSLSGNVTEILMQACEQLDVALTPDRRQCASQCYELLFSAGGRAKAPAVYPDLGPESKRIVEIETVFMRWDRDWNGTIQKYELGRLLKQLNSDFTPEKLELMFSQIDTNADGCIDLEEFTKWLCR